MEGLVLNFNTHPDRSRAQRFFCLPGAGHPASGRDGMPPHRMGAGHAVGGAAAIQRSSSRALNFEKSYRRAPRMRVVRPCAEHRRSTRRIQGGDRLGAPGGRRVGAMDDPYAGGVSVTKSLNKKKRALQLHIKSTSPRGAHVAEKKGFCRSAACTSARGQVEAGGLAGGLV